MIKKLLFSLASVFLVFSFVSNAEANHSWAGYHWARTSNPLSLKLGDNVTTLWDSYLLTASNDWNSSTVLSTNVVAGLSSAKNCKPTLGRVEVCNNRYGNNGWLGIAQIWASGSHITQGVTKLNDTYFNTAKYNTPAWKQMVVCQEVGHTFGLDHQDENFSNINLGTCMDYTNAPAGGVVNGFDYGPSNLSLNAHDYEELSIIYSHLDSTNTSSSTVASNHANIDLNNPSEWGKAISKDAQGKDSVFEKDLGHGNKILTHVIWVQE
jgi:hypothetical protein